MKISCTRSSTQMMLWAPSTCGTRQYIGAVHVSKQAGAEQGRSRGGAPQGRTSPGRRLEQSSEQGAWRAVLQHNTSTAQGKGKQRTCSMTALSVSGMRCLLTLPKPRL